MYGIDEYGEKKQKNWQVVNCVKGDTNKSIKNTPDSCLRLSMEKLLNITGMVSTPVVIRYVQKNEGKD